MNRCQMKISDKAEYDMYQHTAFLARKSKQASRKMRQEFQSVMREIKRNPFLFPLDDDPELQERGFRKALFSKCYKILYRVEDTVIYIDTVADCRMNPDNWIES